MSTDKVATLKRFAADKAIAFALLSDPRSEIIGAFGLRDPKFGPDSPWHGLAQPMILVVDAKGVVRHRFSGRNYRRRPGVEDVLDRLRGAAGG